MTSNVRERTTADGWRAKLRCLKDRREWIFSRTPSNTSTLGCYSQDLRNQLGQERDSVRHISLQKEIEVKDLQTRLEKSVRVRPNTRCPATNRC